MNLTPPSTGAFIAGVALLIIGALLRIDVLNLPDIDQYSFWITFLGGAILAIGAYFKGI